MQDLIYKLAQALYELLGSKFLSVLFTSMLPVVEVRGGIPLGLSLDMSAASSYFTAMLAGLIVVPIILLLLKQVLKWMCKSPIFGSFGKALDGYFNEKAQKVENGAIVVDKKKEVWKYVALFAFVAAPLPLTGFWTGSAIAVFMNLNTAKSFLVVMLGNLTAGGLILLMSLLLGEYSWIILLFFLLMVPVVLGFLVYKIVRKKRSSNAKTVDVVKESSENEQS